MGLRYKLSKNGKRILQSMDSNSSTWKDVPIVTESDNSSYKMFYDIAVSSITSSLQEISVKKPKPETFENSVSTSIRAEKNMDNYIELIIIPQIGDKGIHYKNSYAFLNIKSKAHEINELWDNGEFVMKFLQLISKLDKKNILEIEHFFGEEMFSSKDVEKISNFVQENYEDFESIYNDAVLLGVFEI